jgi:hypothetical protein
VQTGSRIQIVIAEDVEWIGAAGDYVELHVNGRSFLLRETMASLEQRLDPAKFIRIHRSRIVQSKGILELRSIENREFSVKLSDGSEHRSSRTYADRLERWLSSGSCIQMLVEDHLASAMASRHSAGSECMTRRERHFPWPGTQIPQLTTFLNRSTD